MKIYVVIVTYKGKQWYNKCFGSLRESTIPLQTVVVDNTPGDDDAEYIKMHFPEVHLIKTNENLGFGRANNLGMRYALDNGCDYVFLLNQDAWLDAPDTLNKLLTIAEKHPEYGIISPMHLRADKKSLNIYYDNTHHQCSKQLVSDMYCGELQDIYETDFVNAAAWLLPRKTIENVGGFDPLFKHYEEDDNYLNRVIYHGLKIGICPAAKIIHDHQASELSDERKQIRQQQFLLVEWTNINKPFSAAAICRYYMRKWLSYLSAGKNDQAKAQRMVMRYFFKMRKAIILSRNENLQRKASWL